MTRQDGSFLKAGAQQVLLLTDLAGFTGANVDAPLEGVLVAVDAPGRPREPKKHLQFAGRFDPGHRPGAAVDGQSGRLRGSRPHALEPGSLCRPGQPSPKREGTMVCVEVGGTALSALHPGGTGEGCSPPSPMPDRNLARPLAETRRYMEEHLDEPLTIPALSRRACLSATTFKEEFRRMYGLPVHTWLRQRRMERAAELLHTSGLSLEKVAQAVGYSSVSQICRYFPAVLWGDPWKVSKKCLIRQQFGRFGNAAVRSICYNTSIRKGT